MVSSLRSEPKTFVTSRSINIPRLRRSKSWRKEFVFRNSSCDKVSYRMNVLTLRSLPSVTTEIVPR